VPYQITRADDPHRKAAIAAIDRAFAKWSSADCGDGRRPDLATAGRIADADPPAGRTPVGLIEFSDDAPERGPGTLAITRLYSRPTSGEILRARTIFYTTELAPHLALHPGEGSFLDSIALHEAGHFLGLAHSADRSAIMSAEIEDGEIMSDDSERGAAMPTQLTGDDVAAICAVFPPRDGSSHHQPAGALIAIAIAAIAIACAAGRWRRRAAKRRPGDG
jgi:hypothetical protein